MGFQEVHSPGNPSSNKQDTSLVKMQNQESSYPQEVQPTEISAVSVSSRLPEFWCDQPRLWFIQCEAVLTPQKISDEAKFNLVVTKLGKDVIKQVSDILLKPPESRKYEALKTRLLAVYEESENRQLQKLLSEIDLGDQKPSQLLRHMRDLAREKIPDDTLGMMWQSHLPSSIRAVLAVSVVKDLESLAAIADTVLENTRPLQLSEISTPQPPSSTKEITQLQAQIAQLSLQVMELQNRSRHRNNNVYKHRYRNRSRSQGRSVTRYADGNPTRLCFYHQRFRHRAMKCTEPCNWNKNINKTSEN